MKSKTASSEIESNGMFMLRMDGGCRSDGVWSKIQFLDKDRFFDSFYLL